MSTPSKNQIDKAGEVLRDEFENEKLPKKFDLEAYNKISLWRNLHEKPLAKVNTFISITIKLNKLKNSFVAQRLKRKDSIIDKLKRCPNMKLSRMQDIGGVRVVCKSIHDVYSFEAILEKRISKHHDLVLKNKKDYIETPKYDGYRGIHLIVGCTIDQDQFLIEIQIRTELQHLWAMTVELLGNFLNISFKSGNGDLIHKDFFKVLSALFSHEEKSNVTPDYKDSSIEYLKEKLKALENSKQLIRNFDEITKVQVEQLWSNSSNKVDSIIIINNRDNNIVTTLAFTKKNLDTAEKTYRNFELGSQLDNSLFAVMVKIDDLKKLKRAYSSFFVDTDTIIKKLKSYIQ